MTFDEHIYNIEKEQPQVVGRTWADLLYSVRYYIGLLALGIVLYFLRDRIPSVRRISLIVPATLLGLVIGILVGLREQPPKPPPIFIIQPLSQTSARVFLVWDMSALTLTDPQAAPIGTTFGSVIRLAKSVSEQAGRLVVEPSSLHKLALKNPVEALAHVRSLEQLSEQLDQALQRYIELYVSTRASARQLARRRVADLLSIEKQAEKTAKEMIKKSLEGEKK